MDSKASRILIVDDNEDNRYTLELFLRAEGYENLVLAAGGQEALAAVARDEYALVLLDMMMPDLNGEQVLRALRANQKTRELPVIVISATSEQERVSRCIELGADDYLSKPFDPVILRARVASGLRKHSVRAMEAGYRARIEQEVRRSDDLLRRVLPGEIAARLRSGETVIADQIEDASVIFADIVGFTALTKGMHAYEVVSCLNQLFSKFDDLAASEGVEKIKTIGDCYMAVSGAPAPRSDHARCAARLALAMTETAARLGSMFPLPIEIRVGVHSGPVMAGVIGRQRFAYDVWGDTVNTAARLQSLCKPGRVLVSAAAAARLRADFECEMPQTVHMKDGEALEAMFLKP